MLFVITTLAVASLMSGCKYQQDPLEEHPNAAKVNVPVDLKNGDKKEQNPEDKKDTKKPEPPKPIIEYVIKEVPVEKDRIVIKEVAKEVKVYVPVEEEKNWESANLFQIHEVSDLSFVAGEESTATIRATVLHGNATFSLKLLNPPTNSTELKLISTEKNTRTYEFKWKPEVRYLISNGKLSPEKREKLKVQLNLESFEMDDKKKEAKIREAFNAVSTLKELQMVVRKTNKVPKIIPSQNVPTKIEPGQVIPFSITVEAPGTSNENKPILLIEDKKEFVGNLYEGSGARFVNPSANKPIEQIGENLWIFNLELDTTTESIPPQITRQKAIDADATSVILRFGLRVLSNEVSSETSVKRFEIKIRPMAVSVPVEPTSETPVTPTAQTQTVIPTPRFKPVPPPKQKPSASSSGTNNPATPPVPRHKPTN